jgi:hypothetical protein
MTVDESLARGLAHGTHRRAPWRPWVYAEPKRTVEARVRQGIRELKRMVGDHLLFAVILGARKHTVGVAAWLEPAPNGAVEVWTAAFERRGDHSQATGIVVSHHALRRLYQRLGTTRLDEVAQALTKASERLVATLLRGGLPRQFAVPVSGGHLLFTTEREGWLATTYLGPGMRHDLPVL